MKNKLRNNIVELLASLILVLILLSTMLVIYNRKVMIETTEQQELSEETLLKADLVLNNLQAIDLGLRAYAITKSKNHLEHYKTAIAETTSVFDTLEMLLDKQNYHPEILPQLKSEMNKYVTFCNNIVKHIDSDQDSLAKVMIVQDKGYEAWSSYQEFYKHLSLFEKGLTEKAQTDYNKASSSSIWMMGILLLVSTPTIFFIVYLLKRAARKRKQLFIELESNNRKYNFDPGEQMDISNEYQLINSYIENSKKAASFVNNIAEGEYNVDWAGLTQENLALNQENLAGALVKMRDRMQTVKKEEEERLWTTQGLAQFSELIRNHQENIESLAYESVVFIVKYMKAQQGGLFLVNTDEENNKYIELAACYAFERKKYINKRINIGEGLVGQVFMEAETIFLKEIPEGYARIASGLGDSTAKYLLIVPMKYNDEVQAIIEIAGFVAYTPYQIEYVEKIGEFVASAVAATQTNAVTKQLLIDAQQMTEEMKAQEEEMRQNMEELSATQEEMNRKEKEYVKRIQELEAKAQAPAK